MRTQPTKHQEMTRPHQELLAFIADCVRSGRVYWTYHSNMRLTGRSISRELVLDGLPGACIVETYEHDTPLPSCLCLFGEASEAPIHVVVALDRPNRHVRVVTVYKPDPTQWDPTFRRRAR